MSTIKAHGLALLIAALPVSTTAEELPAPISMFFQNGIICDTHDQVRVLLAEIAIADGIPEKEFSGCSMRRDAWMPIVATPIEWYETPIARVLIAELDAGEYGIQYGWIAFETNPDYQPASQDTAL